MRNSFFYLLLLICSSCEKDLEVDFPFEGERLVLFSELKSGERIEVKVDKTYPPTGNIRFVKSFLNNTIVEIYENGIFLERLSHFSLDSHLFYSKENRKPEVGKTYEIKARVEGIPEVSSLPTSLLPPVKIDSIWITPGEYMSPINPSIPAYLVNVAVSNIPTEVPYLFFEIDSFFGDFRTSAQVASLDDLGELETPCTFGGSSERYFKVSCYSKEKTVFQFLFESRGTVQPPGELKKENIDAISFSISSVNENHFNYTKLKNEPLNFFTVFEGVNPTFSTLKNGYGVVLTKNTVSKKLNI